MGTFQRDPGQWWDPGHAYALAAERLQGAFEGHCRSSGESSYLHTYGEGCMASCVWCVMPSSGCRTRLARSVDALTWVVVICVFKVRMGSQLELPHIQINVLNK